MKHGTIFTGLCRATVTASQWRTDAALTSDSIRRWPTAAGLWLAACLVCAAQNPAGPRLQSPIIINGTNVLIKWDSGGTLQLAPAPTGLWTTVTSAVTVMSMFTEHIGAGARFYRVVQHGIPGEAIPIFPATPKNPLPVQLATIRKLPQATDEGNAVLEMSLASD